MSREELADQDIFPKYLEALLPRASDEADGGSVEWEGRIAAIRREIKATREALDSKLNSELSKIAATLDANHRAIMDRLDQR